MMHGIMFHHFHDENKHIKCQGSLSAQELDELLDYYQNSYKLISAREFHEKVLGNKLDYNEACLTFDDTLKCQYDIAYPILKARGLTAFWFVNTLPLEGGISVLELYHHFRFKMFHDVDEFYETFFECVQELQKDFQIDYKKSIENFDYNSYKKNSTFYTYNDKKFRYIRDVILKEESYNQIMHIMMERKGYDAHKVVNDLWISVDDVHKLYGEDHIIGLHSHTHPTMLSALSYDEQLNEFRKNKEILASHNISVDTASYPCNDYNNDTLIIMNKLGIEIGFRANMQMLGSNTLEMPRENHTYIVDRMKRKDSG
ncbi:MAG: polysaccharide deacetylase family protein [Lachnospiraceae bacterium]|nr:polysaccharide deacetylase family protein [Lachnospiraceae bacterium]MDE6186114.1 polysaccharide deacetylase family protein [Lachnospiraceae bacterium]MDE7287186.1 polysaccharide deacetylase family protein [Lachnospiraceae bacterium]